MYDIGPLAPVGHSHAAVIKKTAGSALGIREAGQATAVQEIGVLHSGNQRKTGLYARCFRIARCEQGAAIELRQADRVNAREPLRRLRSRAAGSVASARLAAMAVTQRWPVQNIAAPQLCDGRSEWR